MEANEEGVRSSTSYGANWPGVNGEIDVRSSTSYGANWPGVDLGDTLTIGPIGDPLPALPYNLPYLQPTGLWPASNEFHFTVDPGPATAVQKAQELADRIGIPLKLSYFGAGTSWCAQLGQGNVDGQATPEEACEELLQQLLALGAAGGI